MKKLDCFKKEQLQIVNDAVAVAEELVSNFYKMSAGQWRRSYDVKTLADLYEHEIVYGPLAQVIRYEARPRDAALGSAAYDFYKICIQDHTVLATLEQHPDISIFHFMLYIVTHELIHVVRFSSFLQFFHALPDERAAEEKRVHEQTREILARLRLPGLESVLDFYRHWSGTGEEMDTLR